jgi:hypothetical protein
MARSYTPINSSITINGSRINLTRNDNIRATADSEYVSLRQRSPRQFSHGLFFRVAYTYGKALDDASDVFNVCVAHVLSANLSPNGLGQDSGPSVWITASTYRLLRVGTAFHSSNGAGDFKRLHPAYHYLRTTQLQSGYHSSFNLNGIDMNGDGSTANIGRS